MSGTVADRLLAALEAGRDAVLLTVVEGPGSGAKLLVVDGAVVVGSLGDDELDRVARRDALGDAMAAVSEVRRYGRHGEAMADDVAVFVETFQPPPRMVLVGAVDFTGALVGQAKLLGYHVTVADARPVFATAARFPDADVVEARWPHEVIAEMDPPLGPRDALCVLTHDAKFDVPAVLAGLASEVGYLGVMGSRRTDEDRRRRLRREGVGDADLARLMAPIGLDLGARTPAEVAVAIAAEIVALRAGRPAPHLRDGTGPIH